MLYIKSIQNAAPFAFTQQIQINNNEIRKTKRNRRSRARISGVFIKIYKFHFRNNSPKLNERKKNAKPTNKQSQANFSFISKEMRIQFIFTDPQTSC